MIRPIANWRVQIDNCGTMNDDVTRILNSIEQGDPNATSLLLPLVYEELRRLAGRKMAARAHGTDARCHGLGPRGVFATGGRWQRAALGQSRPFLCSRGRGDAADSD